MEKPRLLRIVTVSVSLLTLLKGQFRYMHQQGFDVLTASADGIEVAEIKKEGVGHFVIPFTRTITPVRDLVNLWRLVRLMKKYRPQIVHTHTPKAGLLGMMAARICKVPVRLHTVAGMPSMEAHGIRGLLLRVSEKITYACSHRVYPNSAGLMNYMKTHFGAYERKFKLIGKGSSNGIDTNFFKRTDDIERLGRDIRSRHNIPQEAIVFGFVGRIVKDKGIAELVNAFQLLQKKGNENKYYLLLIGSFEHALDPIGAEIDSFLTNCPQIVLAGFQSDIRPWLVASDIFVFPSYREGFPNVVMQAGCMELPCIVTDINGCNELIQDGINGFLIPTKNPIALYERMLGLGDNKELARKFSSKTRPSIVDKFEQIYFWGELEKEYSELLRVSKNR